MFRYEGTLCDKKPASSFWQRQAAFITSSVERSFVYFFSGWVTLGKHEKRKIKDPELLTGRAVISNLNL